MPQHWSKTEAFAHFGVSLDNVRWSWSGISDDEQTVVILLWQDGVRGNPPRYADEEDLDAEWRTRLGHHARVRHLKHCVEKLDGNFRAVIARAENVTADPRKIASCFPHQKAVWKIDSFDETSGAFTAHVLT